MSLTLNRSGIWDVDIISPQIIQYNVMFVSDLWSCSGARARPTTRALLSHTCLAVSVHKNAVRVCRCRTCGCATEHAYMHIRRVAYVSKDLARL